MGEFPEFDQTPVIAQQELAAVKSQEDVARFDIGMGKTEAMKIAHCEFQSRSTGKFEFGMERMVQLYQGMTMP